MQTIIYDCEVFAYDWLVVLKNCETGEYTVVHNDNDALRECINDETIYIGFNSKHYDQYIIKAIICDYSPQEVKQVNDFIMSGNQGWEHPLLKGKYYFFNNVDIRDDLQMGLSLKAIEGHLGLPIKESSVPFDIDRLLTEDELQETIDYCKFDVDTTEKLIELRKDYLKTKLNLGQRVGISVPKALAMTNAKITAAMLGAQKKEWNDGRKYIYPANLDKSVIPNEILKFFDTIYDENISDDELFKTSLKTEIGNMPCKYAWGGVHGSLTCYHEKSTNERIIQNRDVSSLYPSLIVEYDYLSRNVPSKDLFRVIRDERIAAKHSGDKQTANDLKLPLNTVSGAQENKYNDLYDPLPTRSLRISGQLFLTMLAIRLLNTCKTIKLLNFNTDGLMYSISRYELPIVDTVCTEWENETRFELETDDIDRVWIKDVNNLLSVDTNGKIKTVGGYLNYGISVKGAWAINNNATIVKKAITEYFVKGKSVEETICGCDDIFQFQIIAKAGMKYKEAYHVIDGEQKAVQKVNRVYATANEKYGRLYKVKTENNSIAKIEMLPDHCVIDNNNELDISDVDKTFYIEMAKKRINDFIGIKPEKNKNKEKKNMATTVKKELSTYNVYQKLMKARLEFLETEIQKTGKNMHLTFKYFELNDIVPTAIRIFEKTGLAHLVNFSADTATMTIINVDNPDENVSFMAPFNQIAPIVSNAGKQATNEMQALGSSITYMRRYLYMMALDICENDSIDNSLGGAPTLTDLQKNQPPATPEQREEVKETLTKPKGNASDLQIKQLKTALKKLKDKHPEKEEMIAKIAVDTQGFTIISKSDCEEIMMGISKLLEDDEKEENIKAKDEK